MKHQQTTDAAPREGTHFADVAFTLAGTKRILRQFRQTSPERVWAIRRRGREYYVIGRGPRRGRIRG